MPKKRKRKLFDELKEGVKAMQKQREGKTILCSHRIKELPRLEVGLDEKSRK